jgi:hypothetical protein
MATAAYIAHGPERLPTVGPSVDPKPTRGVGWARGDRIKTAVLRVR